MKGGVGKGGILKGKVMCKCCLYVCYIVCKIQKLESIKKKCSGFQIAARALSPAKTASFRNIFIDNVVAVKILFCN